MVPEELGGLLIAGALLQRLRMKVPENQNPDSYFSALAIPCLLWVIFGMQAMMAAFILLPPPGPRITDLTRMVGVFNFRPELDVPIYLGGLLLTLGLVAASVGIWNRRPGAGKVMRAPQGPYPAGWFVHAMVGVVGTGAFLWGYVRAQRYVLQGLGVPGRVLVLFAASAGAVLLAAVLGPRVELVSRAPVRGGVSKVRPAWTQVWSPRPVRPSPLDGLFLAAVVLIVYIPNAGPLAARVFDAERFFHWDFFVMGPALAYRRGAALGTDVLSFYGVGLPAVFAALSPIIDLSYASLMYASAVYGCIYFAGVYVLLRLLTGRPVWAGAGTLAALAVHLFSGLAYLGALWRFPSVTVMRRPLDIWFFIVLVMYVRSRRTAWLFGAAALAGFAIFLETDTGAYLGATLAVFCLCRLALAHEWRRQAPVILGSAALAIFVLVAGLWLASRGTLLRSEFWTGWLQNLNYTSAGYTLMPLMGRLSAYQGGGPPDGPTLLAFFGVATIYMLAMANLLVKVLHRCASGLELITGSLAFYGFLALLQFLGRSDPLNLYPPLVPFVILVTVILSRLQLPARTRPGREPGAGAAERVSSGRIYPLIAIVLVVVYLASNSAFGLYPNLLNRLREGRPRQDLCLAGRSADVCGFPSERQPLLEEYRQVIDRLRSLGRGSEVAILDQEGPLFYQAAGVRPWGDFQPALPNLVTGERMRAFRKDLLKQGPQYIFMRPVAKQDPFYQDIWTMLNMLVEQRYASQGMAGPFQVWKLRAEEGPGAKR